MFGEAQIGPDRSSASGRTKFILATIILLTAAAAIAAVFSFSEITSLAGNDRPNADPAPSVTLTACNPAPNGIVGWWPGNGNTNDIRGGHNATLVNGAGYAAGMVEQAFSFNESSNQYLDVPAQASFLLNNNAGTIMAWINPYTVGDNDMVAVFGSGSPGEGVGLGVWGVVRIYHHNGAYDWQSTTPIDANVWTHIAYTWDSTTERIYKNGVFAESRPRNFNYVPGNARIGYGWWGDGANYFPGKIDEVLTFNRTLDATEIAAIHNAGSAGTCPCSPAPPDMTAWWPGEGNANDIQGPTFENGSLMNGAGFTPGKVGQAFSFDGVDDYVSIPDSTALDLTQISISFWVKLDEIGRIHELVNKFGPEGSNTLAYGTEIGPNNRICFRISTGGTIPTLMDVCTVTQLNSGVWYHFAGTYNGTEMKVYLNGQLEATGSQTGNIFVNNENLRLGSYGYFPWFLKGQLDEVHLTGRAYTAQEIQDIYNAGSTGMCRECTPPPPNMTQWWPGEGNSFDIQGPTFENGTNVNGVVWSTGMVNQAFDFDGASTRYVTMNPGSPVGSFGTDPFTVDFWMYARTDPPGVDAYLAGKSHPDGVEGWDIRYNDGRIKVRGINGAGIDPNIVSDVSVGLNSWHLIALSGTASEVRLYVDGVLKGTSPRAISTTSAPFRFGNIPTNTGIVSQLNSILDEIEIFNRTLSQEEIQAIFNAGSSGKCRDCTPPPPNMISWWTGDGNTNDIIGGYHASWVNGGTYAAGKVAEAFNFDGDDDLLAIPNMPELDFGTGEFTVDFWARSPEQGRRMNAIAFLPDYPNRNLIFDFNDPDIPGQGLWVYWNGSGDNRILAGTPNQYTDGNWHHFALTRSGTLFTLYVNGENVGTTTYSEALNLASINNVIGGGLGAGHWNGQIDEVEIFGRALAANEVAAIFNAGSAGKCRTCVVGSPTTVSWWRAEDNANDSVDGNHGTLQNGAGFAAGAVGRAFSFDGSDDVVSVPDAANLNFAPTAPMTVHMWAYPTRGGDMHLIGKRSNCFDSGQSGNYQIANDTANGLHFNSGAVLAASGQQIVPNEWQHIAATSDGTTFRLYRNGQQIASAPGTLGANNNGAPVIIGGVCTGVGATFPGKLDEVLIIGEALPPSEIDAIYKAGSLGICPLITPTPTPTPTPTLTPTPTPTPTPCSLSVTTTTDGPAGSGSLRSAIICANTTVGADVVAVPAGTYMLSLTGPNEDLSATGDLDITEGLVLNGAGAATTIINGGQADRVFDVIGSTTASFNGLTITNGTSTECAPVPGLGACGGGILNRDATVNVNNSVVSSSIASIGNADGGGIFNSGASGTLNIVDSTLIGNSSIYGGAISGGGAINVTGSTIIGNSAGDYGGGIYTGGPTTIVNSTITGNSATSSGSAVLSFVSLTITNSTINGHGGGAAVDNYTGTTVIRSSILGYQQPGSLDCSGTITSGGYNIETGTSCGFTGPGDRQGIDPLVADFGNHGGPTETYSLQVGSPAINAIPIGVNGCGTTITIDQRGIARPQGPACDIGAFESVIQPPPLYTRGDFDGDNKTDASVYRPDGVPPDFGVWYLWRSAAGFYGVQFGVATDIITPGDYDGDNKTDVAVARLNANGMDPDFFVINSATGTFSYPVWGNPGDVPVCADYDGDRKADIAVWRPSDGGWYIQNSTGGVTAVTHGQNGDKPVPMDFDGDGRANIAYFRPSTGDWVIQNQTTTGTTTINFGLPTDKLVPADYDGDGKDDIAVFRDGLWIILQSSNGQVLFIPFGTTGDIPVPGDYDADDKYDVAVYREGVWHMLRSGAGYTGLGFGTAGDIPIPKGYLP